jgi:hypothetical protein
MWRLRARDERYAWRDAKLREGRSFASKSILSSTWHCAGITDTKFSPIDLSNADGEWTATNALISVGACTGNGASYRTQTTTTGGQHENLRQSTRNHSSDSTEGSIADMRNVPKHAVQQHQGTAISGADPNISALCGLASKRSFGMDRAESKVSHRET